MFDTIKSYFGEGFYLVSFLAIIKFISYFLFILIQAKTKKPIFNKILLIIARQIIGIATFFAFVIFPTIVFHFNTNESRLGFPPILLVLIVIARPIEWRLIQKYGKKYFEHKDSYSFVLKGSAISYLTDVLTIFSLPFLVAC